MGNTWEGKWAGVLEGEEAVAEQKKVEVWLHSKKIPLPTRKRKDPSGQGISRSQPRGEGRMGQAVTWEVLACVSLVWQDLLMANLGTRTGVEASVHGVL